MLLNTNISEQGPSKTLQQDDDNNRHPRQSFIYNTSIKDMFIYHHARGISVESSLLYRKLLSFE